jgi:hypothetical protein
LDGKLKLYRFGVLKNVRVCCGFVGGSGGARLRFCCRVLEPGKYRCDDSKHGNGKFEPVRDSYFIRMENDSALCWPFVSWKDLDAWDELDLLDEEHSSKEWVALLLDLLKAHGLADPQGNPVELKPPAVTSSGGGLFDEDDEVSRLDDEMDTEQVEYPLKLSKRFFADSDSVSATPSTYRRWNTLAPQVELASLENAPSDAAWYGPVSMLTTSLVSLKTSMLELLRTIPLALANLDKKMQDWTDSEISSKAVVPLRKLNERVDGIDDVAFGDTAGTSRLWLKEEGDNLLEMVLKLQEKSDSLVKRMDTADSAPIPKNFALELKDLATKAASVVKAANSRAKTAEANLEGRIAALEALSGAKPVASGAEVSAVDVFAAAVGDDSVPTPSANLPTASVLAVVDGEPITVAKLMETYKEQQTTLKAHRKELDSLKTWVNCVRIL